jgi:protein gp37
MADGSTIEWLNRPGTKPATWNPVRGCTRVSEGCVNCYAETMAARFSDPGQWGHGFAETVRKPDGASVRRWTGKVELIEDMLTVPLRWCSPRTVFVNSTSDLFHERLRDAAIDRVFAVMALCPQHTFLILTKRPSLMRDYIRSRGLHTADFSGAAHIAAAAETIGHDITPASVRQRWPLPNVWLGTSTEDQATADQRIPHLLATPAAVRFVSAEPLLGSINFHAIIPDPLAWTFAHGFDGIDWVIVGGESGPGARLHDLAWDEDILAQCRAAGVAYFEKQAGSAPILNGSPLRLRDKKGGDMSEWPEGLRVRDFPSPGRRG